MSDKEKFLAFKERIVRENEEKYGAEIREKYGDEEMDAANRKMLNMTEEEYERFRLYYDKNVEGCAAFLEAAIRHWVDRL